MNRNRIKISPSGFFGPHVSLCQIDTNSNYASRNRNELSNPLTGFFDLVGCALYNAPFDALSPFALHLLHPHRFCVFVIVFAVSLHEVLVIVFTQFPPQYYLSFFLCIFSSPFGPGKLLGVQLVEGGNLF